MKAIEAIYEDGVFKPLEPVDLPEHSRVRVEPDAGDDPVAILRARYPDSFGGLARAEGEEMMRAIDEQFERIDPDAWK